MELEVSTGQEKSELSVIEIARTILEERGRDHEMYFSDLVNEIQNYLEKSDAEIREALPYFYSVLNVDGGFIPFGGNEWGLRLWYTTDEIDEGAITFEKDENGAPKRKPKRVNAFMDGDEDTIDYSDDDPEGKDFTPGSLNLEYDEENPDGEKSGIKSYDSEINEIIPDKDLDEEIDINEENDKDDNLDEE